MKLEPLGDKVVLRKLSAKEVKSGAAFHSKEKPEEAVVVAVGNNTSKLKVSDKIIYSKHAGVNMKIDEEEFVVVHESDIWAIIND